MALISERDAELQRLRDRIAVLEDALGMTPANVPNYGLSRTEATIYAMFGKVAVLSKERIYLALYGDRLDPPSDKVIEVTIYHMRTKLAKHGIEIVNHYGLGYALRTAEQLAA